MTLAGHTALVTGAGRNIGRAIALAFAKEGANVVVNARSNQREVDAVVREAQALGAKAIGTLADISNAQQVQAMVERAREAFGVVDILVNNAAVRPGRPFAELDYAEWRRILGIDLDGAFLCTKAVLPGMIAQRWGRIINIAGMMAYEGHAGYTPVSAAKMGLVGLTRSLSVELAPHNILVNAISPGTIDTANPLAEPPSPQQRAQAVAQRVARVPLGRLGTPEEIASVCLFLASEGGSYISGQTIHVNGAADRR
ncbi:MAG: 3-oxoacyl-ACP reductase FabG [Chloroflexi bacterium]|nr:3-oxoacyl-ACP reductase FabG [Chloroflexota bacterium]